MTMTDTRFSSEEKAILAGMIGKTLDEFAHDSNVVNPSSYMSVWIAVDGVTYEVHRETTVLERFGEKDDVAVSSLRQAAHEDMRTHIAGRKLVVDKIGRTIEDIKIVEDTQVMSKDESTNGTFAFTAAIVFDLGRTELVLEPDTWFSEAIFIERGPGASKKLPDAIEDVAMPARKYTVVSREVISLREWAKSL